MRNLVPAALIAMSLSAAADDVRPGVVRGTVVLEGVKSAGWEVHLFRQMNDGPVVEPVKTATGPDGSFEFTGVEPGLYAVGVLERFEMRSRKFSSNFYTSNHTRNIAVEPGETQEVTLGGTGRRITGKIVPPEGLAQSIALLGATGRRIYTPISDRARAEPGYRETAAFREEYETMAVVMLDLEADGSFTAHDVPPGHYVGYIEVADDDADNGRPIGQAKLDFTVPEGEYNSLIELGVVEITMNEDVAKAE